ncbi:MAG: type II secretion system F family protein [Candidatus Sericytochromatia bacterium]|nr:type II secretion system F family protein [Candidatus Sericytochromatia bacterium]
MSNSALFLAFFLLFGAFLVFLLVGWSMVQKQKRRASEPNPQEERDQGELADPAQALTKKLRQAGLEPDPAAFLRRWRIGALTGAIVGIVMGGFGAGGVLFGGLLGYSIWRAREVYLHFKWNQRMAEFLDQFTDALGVMANGVKSGQTVLQTFETIALDFGDPISSEVTEVLQELRMGVPLDNALEAWAERIPLEDLEIATTALSVQRQTGGNVAEILDTVAETIRQRNKLQKQIRTLTTQGRMSGWVLGLLPVGLFVAMFLIAPERTGLLLTHPIGILMTAIGSAMIAAGGFFIQRIVSIEV